MPTILSTRSERRGGIAVLAVSGEVDISTAARLGHAIQAAAAPDTPLVVDMTEVGFLDSAGARALMVADEAMAERGAALMLVPSEDIAQLFEVAGLRHVLRLFGAVDEALEMARKIVTGGEAPADA